MFTDYLKCQSFLQERQCGVFIDSDEDIDGGFSCLIDAKETGN